MATSVNAVEVRPVTLKLLLACGVIGPLVFIGAFLIEGATRPGYNAWHHVISTLSLGEQGWEQTANFLLGGTLVVMFAFGLRRVLHPGTGSLGGPVLIGIVGLCTIGAGLAPTDPAFGYPPGASSVSTLHGTLHTLFGTVMFLALLVACFALARRFWGDPAWRGFAWYTIAAAVLWTVFLFAQDVVSTPDPSSPAGFFQRLSIIVGWSWIGLLALRLLSIGRPLIR
jgi:hypothetical membrane protein